MLGSGRKVDKRVCRGPGQQPLTRPSATIRERRRTGPGRATDERPEEPLPFPCPRRAGTPARSRPGSPPPPGSPPASQEGGAMLLWPSVTVLGFLALAGLVVALGRSSTARFEFERNHVRREQQPAVAGAPGHRA